MAKREGLPHIVVPAGRTETRRYTYPRPVVAPPPPLPPRNPGSHGSKLKADLAAVRARDDAIDAARAAIGIPHDRGMLLEFESEPGFVLTLESMDRKRLGMEVVSVQERGPVTLAAVLVPDGKLGALEDLLEQYRIELDKRSQRPKGEGWVAPIAAIRRAAVETLWTDEGPLPPAGQAISWEVWLRMSQTAVSDFRTLAEAQGIEVDRETIEFVDRIVVLARASLDRITASVELLDCVAELRRAKDLAPFFMGLPPREQGPWVGDLANRTERVAGDAPVVCLLDTGVNRGHPLLEPFLAPDDLYTVDDAWGRADHRGHGTLMAGLAAWGDLGEHSSPLATRAPFTPSHGLESVVLLPPAGQPKTKEKLWGAYTLLAVSRPEAVAPERERVFCMTVTADDYRDRGTPSSWSAEIDMLCEGRRDELPRLMVVSAGNVPQSGWHGYIHENDTHQVHDPGQAWNAITVGAYTDRAAFDAHALPGHSLIGTPGSLSPASATSLTWASLWPNKPDVVFEGGNGTMSPDGLVELPDALRLLSTYWKPNERLLDTAGDTSGAAALGARFAAALLSRLRAGGQEVWPETVRALMVHSARWTPRMRTDLSRPPKDKGRRLVLRRYGWGVPNLERASNSATNVLTLVAERYIQPFENIKPKGAPEVKTKDWHLFELPWPKDALLGLGNQPVELRVTLSYFVEPNPARRGWNSKRRYQSAGLRFAMKNPLESLLDFRARVSRNEQDEEAGLPSFSEKGWLLTATHRDRGSIHSDVWLGPAIELAERGYLAVHPVGGWWKDRLAAARYDEAMRYALVVSIETADESVDIYTPVAVEVAAEVEVDI